MEFRAQRFPRRDRDPDRRAISFSKSAMMTMLRRALYEVRYAYGIAAPGATRNVSTVAKGIGKALTARGPRTR